MKSMSFPDAWNFFCTEVLRRIVNNLDGKCFEYSEDIPLDGCLLTVEVESLEGIDEVANKIAVQLVDDLKRTTKTKCYRLPIPPATECVYNIRDPVSNLQMRGLRAYDPVRGKFFSRFEIGLA